MCQISNKSVAHVRRIEGKFAHPVVPGVSLITNVWKMSNTVFYFQVLDANSKKIVLDGGELEYIFFYINVGCYFFNLLC